MLLYECRGDAAWLTLNRPEVRNALARELVQAIREGIERADADPTVRAIVLAGAGPVFCAGADLNQYSVATDRAAVESDANRLYDTLEAISASKKPVIARVQRAAYAGAFGLLCASDLVVASDDARFSLSEARLGLVAATIGPWVVRALGARVAKALMILSEPFGAEEALRIGLVQRVVPADELDEAVDAWLGRDPRRRSGSGRRLQVICKRSCLGRTYSGSATHPGDRHDCRPTDERRGSGGYAFVPGEAPTRLEPGSVSGYDHAAGRFQVLAIANRAEIAIRIARTARDLHWRPVALLGDPDLQGHAARVVGSVERVGPAGSELDPALVIAAALRVGASALHPGYGFLSEKATLSAACREAGITFIGPSPETLALCGDKIATRAVARQQGIPLLPAGETLDLADRVAWFREAERIGYPVIAKVAGGGGGRGLREVDGPEDLERAVDSVVRESGASGAGDRIYLERYLRGARHVEVQVAGDGQSAVALGDRDCSIQRRHQKVVEEAPAFGLTEETRSALHAHAVTMARAVGLLGLATVEFLLGRDGTLAFIEINPRLQVEHTVTEEVTGLDLVALQLHLAFGGDLPDPPAPRGHAIQARWYAEDPTQDFVPSPGRIRVLDYPTTTALRLECGYVEGDTVPSQYDSLIAKFIARDIDRRGAIVRLTNALQELRVAGIATNRPWLLTLVGDASFAAATHDLTLAGQISVPDLHPSLSEIAAAAHTAKHGSLTSVGGSVWDVVGPYRMIGGAVAVYHGDEGDGWERRVRICRSVEGWSVVDGEGDNASLSGHSLPSGIATCSDGVETEVSSPAGRWIVKPGPRPKERATDRLADGVVRAPMPGTVAVVHVVSGQRVARDEVVCVMLAMKIEIALASSVAGVVVSVGCAPGDLVGSRQPLVTVQPDPVEGAPDAQP